MAERNVACRGKARGEREARDRRIAAGMSAAQLGQHKNSGRSGHAYKSMVSTVTKQCRALGMPLALTSWFFGLEGAMCNEPSELEPRGCHVLF